jgi:hypothetical protein
MGRHILQKRAPQPLIFDFGRSLVQQAVGGLQHLSGAGVVAGL